MEGWCLALDGVRIAGPKPWGGGTVVHSWKTDVARLVLLPGMRGEDGERMSCFEDRHGGYVGRDGCERPPRPTFGQMQTLRKLAGMRKLTGKQREALLAAIEWMEGEE